MDITNKFWQLCHHLRHDGIDSSDYIEQLTYLLFLKMVDEKGIHIPEGCDWKSLVKENDDNLVQYLEFILSNLQKEQGLLGAIFSEPVSRIKKGQSLRKIIKLLEEIEWSRIKNDVIGIAFEELIGRVANDGKKGAGQYFTPRPLIQAIVEVMKPNPLVSQDFKIADVACGTAGFLTVAAEWFQQNNKKTLSNAQELKIAKNTYFGTELVQRPRRMALMNLFLHGIDASETVLLNDSIDGVQDDIKFDLILTNPPFGSKGSLPTNRKFPIKTSDKQLNFIQHIIEKLKVGGKAAIVLPDSCLTSDKAKQLWTYYMDIKKSKDSVCNVHTVLKLPDGIFAAYANGVKACVIFLTKGEKTDVLWMYDARKGVSKVTTKSNPLKEEHFKEFKASFVDRVPSDRFKPHTLSEIQEKGFDLSFVEFIEPEPLKHPVVIIDEMITYYEGKIKALIELRTKLPLPNNDEQQIHEKADIAVTGISNQAKGRKTKRILNRVLA